MSIKLFRAILIGLAIAVFSVISILYNGEKIFPKINFNSTINSTIDASSKSDPTIKKNAIVKSSETIDDSSVSIKPVQSETSGVPSNPPVKKPPPPPEIKPPEEPPEKKPPPPPEKKPPEEPPEKKPPPPEEKELECRYEIWNHAKEPFGDKLIVVSSFHEDLSWVCELRKYKIPHIVYSRDKAENKYNVVPNHGYEAAIYLKFIIDHYDRLPNMTAFVHGHRHTWHNTRDILDILLNLRWHKNEYMDFNIGPNNPFWQVANPRSNTDYRVIGEQWDAFYKEFFGEMPNSFSFYCCAQFAVARERIRLRPIKFYQQLLDFTLSGRISDYFSSRLLEYTWSYIFGESPNRNKYPSDCYVLRC